MKETLFPQIVDKLKDPLSTSVEVTDAEIFSDISFSDALKGILKEPKKRHGRTDEQIASDVGRGKACEIGIRKLLPDAKVYDSEWILEDRHSYGKDVVTSEGFRIEVKSTKYLHRFALAESSFLTLKRNIEEGTLDVIITATSERNNDKFIVTPGLIIDPCTYVMLCDNELSHLSNKKMYLYRADIAARRNYVAYINRKEEE